MLRVRLFYAYYIICVSAPTREASRS